MDVNTFGNVDDIDPKVVDEITSQELLSLSNEERTRLQEEIHGVRSMAVPERDDMVQHCIERLAIEIDAVPDQDPTKHAFNRGLQLQSRFVTNTNLWLKFLRATFFQPRLAAKRFMDYLGLVSSYFGDDGLMRPIRFSDLDRNEERLCRGGYDTQILAGRDFPLGRRLLVHSGEFETDSACTTTNRIRISLYCLWILSEDEDTQRSGFVNIHFVKDFQPSDPMLAQGVARLAQCAPVRCSAVHFCLPRNDNPSVARAAAIMMVLGTDHRIRTRVHHGNVTDCQYSLRSYGVPVSDIPLTYTGEIKSKSMTNWINCRKAIESFVEESGFVGISFKGIDCPRLADVIFKVGERGTHPGNMRFRELLEGGRRMDRYKSTSNRAEKDEIVWEISQGIHSTGGRFLAWDQRGFFVVIQDQAVLKKQIASFIRDFNKRRAAKGLRNNG